MEHFINALNDSTQMLSWQSVFAGLEASAADMDPSLEDSCKERKCEGAESLGEGGKEMQRGGGLCTSL